MTDEINGHKVTHKNRSSGPEGYVVHECINDNCRIKASSNIGWKRVKEYLEVNPCPSENPDWIKIFISGESIYEEEDNE